MDIFNSQWLISMLTKSSKTPQGRMLSLFDVLSDWLNAPDIKFEINQQVKSNKLLIQFFVEQAQSCRAENPSILAEHIILIAKNAVQLQLAAPSSNSLMHAKKVASALILSQTQKHFLLKKSSLIGMVASVMAITIVSLTNWQNITENYPTEIASYAKPYMQKVAFAFGQKTTNTVAPLAITEQNITKEGDAGITANDAVAMYAKFDQMRKGTCQFPEVLQIPDKHKAIYIQNVVGGKLPTNLHNLAIANHYLESVRCNYTPMLMANSK